MMGTGGNGDKDDGDGRRWQLETIATGDGGGGRLWRWWMVARGVMQLVMMAVGTATTTARSDVKFSINDFYRFC